MAHAASLCLFETAAFVAYPVQNRYVNQGTLPRVSSLHLRETSVCAPQRVLERGNSWNEWTLRMVHCNVPRGLGQEATVEVVILPGRTIAVAWMLHEQRRCLEDHIQRGRLCLKLLQIRARHGLFGQEPCLTKCCGHYCPGWLAATTQLKARGRVRECRQLESAQSNSHQPLGS